LPHFSFAGAAWVLSARYHTLYTHVLPPNSRIPDCAVGTIHGDIGTAAVTARSWHFGGVNVGFGDGNVRMMSDSIDTPVWRAIATVDGAEVIGRF
jgi:prepilin-type processing-associated H-X9-DG protein